MLKKISACACVAACLSAFGAPTMGEDDGKYVIDVPAGETYALTADDVTAIGTLPLVKAGEGTLTVNDVLKDYTGDIYVTNGIYQATTSGAVGTTNGVTHVLDGGTFNSTCAAGTSDGKVGFSKDEKFYICGDGYNNMGAIRQTTSLCANFGGYMTFTGPARIANTERLDFRYGGFDMNGYTLTVQGENGNWFYLVQQTITHPGNIVVVSGGLEFQSYVNGLTTSQTVTMKSGTHLSQWASTSWQNVNLVLEDNAWLHSANGTYTPNAYSQNNWQGPITVQGKAVNDLGSGKQVMFYGKVSGTGYFTGGNGGWLQFYDPANTFTGGIGLKGSAGANGPVGGVATYGTNSIPCQGGTLALTNANAHLMGSRLLVTTLPDVAFDGAGVVSGKVVYATAKSLTKTGTGMLDLWSPLHVKGTLDVQGGGIRIRARIPDAPSGMKWYYKAVSASLDVNAVPAGWPYQGIDKSGVTYAYSSWPNGITHGYFYTGYVRIPGEEGEKVTCNFVSSIARSCHLRIGDRDIIKFNDRTDSLYGRNNTAYSRYHMTPQLELTAGWHPFFLEMGNYYDTTRGPQNYKVTGWTNNFGLGVDWQARCETNYQHYVKFQDPGDGSFLRSAMNKAEAAADANAYRPTFDGPASFGPGTSIDFGDAAPYVPFVFNGLSGCPAIANGELVVSNSWTVSHAQATAQPLTVAAGAKLTFAAGTTLAIEDIDLFSRKPAGTPLVVADDADAITGLPELIGVNHKWKVEASGDGKSLVLRDISGMVLTIR